MSKPILWVMVGLSGSGKSTIAKKIADDNHNSVIVSSDNIREELTGDYEDQKHNEEVFKVFHDRIRKNLENKFQTGVELDGKKIVLHYNDVDDLNRILEIMDCLEKD